MWRLKTATRIPGPGMMIKHVAGIRRAWDSPAINDLQDSYGQEWTYRSTALPGNGVEDF